MSVIRSLTVAVQLLLATGVILAIVQQRWLVAVTTTGIALVTTLPRVLGDRLHIRLPASMELLAVAFVYASLFLGEVHGYYVRFWWWDSLLHMGSGLLLGVLGFLLVHVLNEHESIEMHMRPGFVALFAFVFALGLGALWEIFEFTVDQLFGMTMQKSGLVDTMSDLIVDALSALAISLVGWRSLRKEQDTSFLQQWIQEFVRKNPRLFPHADRQRNRD